MPRCPPRMMLWLMSSRAPWIASDFAETTSGNHDPSGSLMRSEPSRTCKKNTGILFAADALKFARVKLELPVWLQGTGLNNRWVADTWYENVQRAARWRTF